MLRAAALLGSLILIGCTSEVPASQRSPNASPAASDAVPRLSGFSMAYDPGSRKLVMFGASEADFKPTTWTWDRSQWRQEHPATSPPAFGGSMAYDRASASLVLYGLGSDGSPQTWEWTAGTWVERHPPAAPPRFYSFSLGDNEAAGNVIAFGGCCAQDIAPSQTWSWDGSTWKRLQPNTMPIDRVGVNLVYDPAIQKLVLLGGYVRGSGNQSNDLWTWDGESLRVFLLSPRGTYRQSERSKAFPFLPLIEFAKFLTRTGFSETQLLRSFRAWVRKQKKQGWT